MNLTVTRAGFSMTVQDLGRVGSRRFGVSLGGALDAHALRIANFLSGNDEGATGLELTSGTAGLQFRDERIIAWCGGEYEVTVAARSIPAGHSVLVGSNEELIISGPRRGCRAWLAISGGIEVPVVLGSRSTDLRGNFGGYEGRALRDGDKLRLGEKSKAAKSLADSLRAGRVSDWSASAEWTTTAKDEATLRIIRGADWDRFNDVTIQRFTSEAFIVSPDSDRMGTRLEGVELRRREDFDLISEAVVPGTIQIPPNGRPIVLLRDCQTIGGYPKIAHVITMDLSIAAQLRPGDRVRFAECSLADAHRLLREREREVERFRVGLSLHFS
jgi:antagonist of KipI